jgi:predicted alpha/beta-fold hydrolase
MEASSASTSRFEREQTRTRAARPRGDVATISSYARNAFARDPTGARPWRFRSSDEAQGPAMLTGLYFAAPGSRELALLFHGRGGNVHSGYQRPATAALLAMGISVLRVGQRDSSDEPEDLHHGGLWEDFAALLRADPIVARYDRVFVIGFSMGGHLALRLAATHQPRLAAVVSICSPLCMQRTVDHIDRPFNVIYRQIVLRGLKKMYRAVACRRAMPVPVSVVDRARTLREWDQLTVVPRFGFRDPAEYYESQSARHVLPVLATPTLLLYTRHDPMVPPSTLVGVHPGETLSPLARVVWLDGGGHVALPRSLDLGVGPNVPSAPYPQMVAWLRRQPAPSS